MKVPYSWLQELVETKSTIEELGESLSIAGFEVESIENLSTKAKGVVVGFVEQCEKHPNADKLSVCKVNIGKGTHLQIVCGASNIKSKIHVLVATPGAYLSTIDLHIKRSELRGITSEGMICSSSELGIESESDGITILEELNIEIPTLGESVLGIFGLNDVIIDLAITANRPDGMSILGIAKEVAALTGKNIIEPKLYKKVKTQTFKLITENNQAFDNEGIYSLTKLENIDNNIKTPSWIKKRLVNSGIKSINLIVDITNYVMLEQGQPMHAFDADKLDIINNKETKPEHFSIRKSRKNENIRLLDGNTYKTEDNVDLVTCNDIPIAIAGVIGGYDSSVSINSQNIWVETALFSPKSVRESSRSIGIRTESSSRFEKGISNRITISTVSRFLELLNNHTSFNFKNTYINRPLSNKTIEIILRKKAIDKTLGELNNNYKRKDKNLSDKEIVENNEVISNFNYIPMNVIEEKLNLIGCKCNKISENDWKVTIPPQRDKDLTREIDLIEEIARLVGYDNFKVNLPDPIKPGGLNSRQKCERKLRESLSGAGIQEITTMSLVRNADSGEDRIEISNPLLTETSCLRSNLWQEHIEIIKRNISSGQESCWIYEIGNIYIKENHNINEKKILAGVLNGKNRFEKWTTSGKNISLDYFEARGKLKEVFKSINLDISDIANNEDPILHPGRASKLILEGNIIGRFGQFHPYMANKNDLSADTYLFEIELEPIINTATRKNNLIRKFRPFPTVPFMERDISLIVDKDCKSSEIISVIRKSGKPLLENVDLIDRYDGGNLPSGKISQAFRIRYRDKKTTLSEDDITPIHERIRKNLETKLNAELRS
tara:strand:- start:3872 stop:6382 length:2511 start_codon:yes stop_codon:yes gene_type:complete